MELGIRGREYRKRKPILFLSLKHNHCIKAFLSLPYGRKLRLLCKSCCSPRSDSQGKTHGTKSSQPIHLYKHLLAYLCLVKQELANLFIY